MSDNLNSQNKKSYATFDADNYSEAGLTSFVKMLADSGAPVASVTASNRAIRKGLTSFKKADFYFENGQRAMVRIGDAGDIVIVEINGKAVPLNNATTLKGVAGDIADYLKRGQARFDKSLAKKLKAIKVESAVRPASVPLAKKLEQVKSAIVESEQQEQQALAAVEQAKKDAAESESRLAEQKKALDLETAKTRQLKEELRLLGA